MHGDLPPTGRLFPQAGRSDYLLVYIPLPRPPPPPPPRRVTEAKVFGRRVYGRLSTVGTFRLLYPNLVGKVSLVPTVSHCYATDRTTEVPIKAVGPW